MPVRMDASEGYRPPHATVKARWRRRQNNPNRPGTGSPLPVQHFTSAGARKAANPAACEHSPRDRPGSFTGATTDARRLSCGLSLGPKQLGPAELDAAEQLRSTACVTRSAIARTSGAPVGAARMRTSATPPPATPPPVSAAPVSAVPVVAATVVAAPVVAATV